jgi:iron complex transport system ATP-binding protein
MLEVKNLGYNIGSQRILEAINAYFSPGQFSMIIGPNGSGKSTLLKIISNEIKGFSGSVLYEQKEMVYSSRAELAKARAVLSQQSDLSFPLSVEDVVMMGRYPHFTSQPSSMDHLIVTLMLEKMDITSLRYRNYLTLSGGEKQKTHFARVLAQITAPPENGCRYLFLDEPIAFMDLNYQHEFLRIARSLARENTVVIAVVHDLNLALQYADRVLALNKGRVIGDSTPEKVITPKLIDEMYKIKSNLITPSESHFPVLITGI